MYKECFLANSIASINDVFDGNIVDVVEPTEYEKESGDVISPQMFADIRVTESADAGEDEGQDEDGVEVDPDAIGEEVVVVPVNGLHPIK